MKVMKFGGTSVGSVESLMNVKRIVEGSARPTVAVVSALSGVTDNLIAASNEAAAGRESYQDIFNRIVERHHTMVNDVISAGAARDRLMGDIDTLLEELNSIYKGVFLIQDLTPKTADAIVAYGVFVGAADTLVPCLMNFFSIWAVRLSLAAWLAPSMGLKGVWVAMCVELCFRGMIFLVRLWRGKWMKGLHFFKI